MERRGGQPPVFLIVTLGLLVAGNCSSKVGLSRSSDTSDGATDHVVGRPDGAPDGATVDRATVDAAADVRPATDASATCAGLPRGAPAPAGACPDAGPASCGFDGRCDGAGGCRRYEAGTLCAAATCLDSATFQPPSLCDGQGTCVVGPPLTCSPYTCVNGACYVDDCKFNPTDCVGPRNRDASPG